MLGKGGGRRVELGTGPLLLNNALDCVLVCIAVLLLVRKTVIEWSQVSIDASQIRTWILHVEDERVTINTNTRTQDDTSEVWRQACVGVVPLEEGKHVCVDHEHVLNGDCDNEVCSHDDVQSVLDVMCEELRRKHHEGELLENRQKK